VAEHVDLDCQFVVATSEKVRELEDPDEPK
jgi:hypothetical protein